MMDERKGKIKKIVHIFKLFSFNPLNMCYNEIVSFIDLTNDITIFMTY